MVRMRGRSLVAEERYPFFKGFDEGIGGIELFRLANLGRSAVEVSFDDELVGLAEALPELLLVLLPEGIRGGGVFCGRRCVRQMFYPGRCSLIIRIPFSRSRSLPPAANCLRREYTKSASKFKPIPQFPHSPIPQFH